MIEHIEVKDFTVFDELTTENAKKTEEGIGRDQRFWRLAQAISAPYPSGVDEKRWADGILMRNKGLGF